MKAKPEGMGMHAQEEPQLSGEDQVKPDAISDEELAGQSAADLPEREAMSVLHGGMGIENLVCVINEAQAANIFSAGSIAVADADQVVIADQVADNT